MSLRNPMQANELILVSNQVQTNIEVISEEKREVSVNIGLFATKATRVINELEFTDFVAF